MKIVPLQKMFKSNKLILFTLLILLFGCRKDFERANWDVDLIAPLAKTTLDIKDILPDSVLQTNLDSSLKLVYQTAIFDLAIDSFIKIPDTTVSDFFSIPFSSLATPGNFFYSNGNEIKLNVGNGIELTHVLVESGFIETTIFNEIQEAIIIEYTIPSATINGDTLILRETIPAGTPTQAGFFTKKVDISDYELNLTGLSQSEVNTVVTVASSAIDTNAPGPVVIFAGEKLSFTNKLIDVVPRFVRGYFGNQQISIGPETTDFNLFGNVVGGNIDLEEVDVQLRIENGIGADAQIVLHQFETVNTNLSSNTPLTGSILNSSININRAQQTFSLPEVNYSNKNVQINTLNSNIDQSIEIFPNQLIYGLDLNINPFGNLSGHNDFLFKDHTISAQLDVEVPLSFISNNLTLAENTTFSLDAESDGNSRIIDGDLIIYAENGFPFDASLTLELLDENNNIISTISSFNRINAAPVNSALRVIQKESSRITYPLSADNINQLYNADQISIKIAFTTQPQSQFIKIYEEYEIDLKVVGDFSYNINLQ